MPAPAILHRLLHVALPLLVTTIACATWAQARVPDPPEVMRRIIDRANEFRRSQGRAPLAPEPQLDAAARGFVAYLASTDRFGHDADGRTPSQRAGAVGYAWCMVAENLALEGDSRGFESAELANRLVDGWIRSEGHRRNLLSADATQTGVAIAHSTRSDRWYAVQMFGRPASERVTFEIVNRSGTTVSWRIGDQRVDLPAGTIRTDETCDAADAEVSLPGRTPMRLQPRGGTRLRIEATPARQLQISEE